MESIKFVLPPLEQNCVDRLSWARTFHEHLVADFIWDSRGLFRISTPGVRYEVKLGHVTSQHEAPKITKFYPISPPGVEFQASPRLYQIKLAKIQPKWFKQFCSRGVRQNFMLPIFQYAIISSHLMVCKCPVVGYPLPTAGHRLWVPTPSILHLYEYISP
jgi:hypothetical protein